MKPKSLLEFIKYKYKNSKYSLNLNNPIISKIGLFDLFEEDIKEYEEYLQRIEELETVPKYAL